ncbi:MAG: Ppx/GppA family phosphatase [Gammaproteobacteria bacterium]
MRYLFSAMLFKKTKHPQEGLLAAVDLGSNSFHMIVVHLIDGNLQVVDRLREIVRLRAGLDRNNNLSTEAQQRALECLQRFAQRLKQIPSQNIRVVGTNTLRSAKNTADFIANAQQILGQPIQIISGIEEARLIYLGVAHSLAEKGKRRLVLDIGGGSTEIIIGESFNPILMESLPLGCVSMTLKYFANGKITPTNLRKANFHARLELESTAHLFVAQGWEHGVGSSGTVRSIARILQAQGWSTGSITLEGLKNLRSARIKVFILIQRKT